MANIFHEDFRDFLSALNKADVRYIFGRWIFSGFTWLFQNNRTYGFMG
jgi:hypothetical protein